MNLFSLSLGQLDRRIRCKSGRDRLFASAETTETGERRSLFVNLYFQVFNLFKRLEFMRGGKEVDRAWKDREPKNYLSFNP